MNIIILGSLGYWKNMEGQRQWFLAKEFAKHHKVLYLETHDGGIKQDGNIKIDSFLHGNWLHNSYDVNIMRNKLNTILSRFIDTKEKSVVIFEIPLSGYINCIPTFRKFGCKIIYDCIDNWRYFYGGTMIDTDRTSELINQSNAIICTANNLMKDLKIRFNNINAPMYHIPNAYGELGNEEYNIEVDNTKINTVYFGSLGEWFSHQFLYEVALVNHHLCFHVFGNFSPRNEFTKHDFEKLFQLSNCHFYGPIKRNQIKSMLSKMDYGIIPFIDNPLIHCTDAVKSYEMISCGIKVLYPNYMYELDNLPTSMTIKYKSKNDIINLPKNNYINKQEANDFIKENTWKIRYNNFMEVINAL
ncbi:MAG TPA: hypothetical protein PKI46_01730 [Bacteroidales bacterium]|nr:hypothetical protein [Bacteroidales bacterium]